MSRLRDTPAAELKAKYGLEVFVETGCGDGEGLRYAREIGFERRFTCDVDINSAVACGSLGNVCISDSLWFLGNSFFMRPAYATKAFLFWLDAHFPHKFGVIQDDAPNFPLLDELKILARKPGIERDAILCDDMHAIQSDYNPTREDGPGHDWEPVYGLTIAELVAPFERTHNAEILAVSTGLLVLTPK